MQNFPRDMQWGQALQLIEDCGVATDDSLRQPTTLWVEEGDMIGMQVQYSEDSVLMCFRVGLADSLPMLEDSEDDT